MAGGIDYIEVGLLPPFTTPDEYWGPLDYRWAYNVANRLHIKTKRATVQRFLSFEVGDSLTPELVIEAERRLRQTDFIGEAKIELIRTDSGNVASVIAQDLWTTKLAPSLSYKGRVFEWAVEAEEVNLLGYGVGFSGKFRHDEDYDSWFTSLKLPKMLPGHSTLSFAHSNATENVGPKSTGIAWSRQRHRDSDRFMWNAGAYRRGGNYPMWLDGHTRGPEYSIDDEGQYFGAKYLIGERFGIGGGFTNASLMHEKTSGDFPDETDRFERKLRVLTAGVSLVKREYLTVVDVDAFGRTEDIPYGVSIALEGGVGPKDYSPYGRFTGIVEMPMGPIFGAFSCGFLRYSRTESYYTSFRFFSDKFLWSRIAGRLYYGTLSNEPPDTYYMIGGQSCLRGYSTYAQTGDRAIYGNLEWRFFTPIEILSVRLGACAFVDFGTAWDLSREEIALSDLPDEMLGDYGIELRFGSRSSTTGQILRASVARTFDNTWEFELSSGQLFKTILGLDHRVPLP